MFCKTKSFKNVYLVFKVSLLVLLLCVITNMGLLAQEIPQFEAPILVTSAGQVVDYKTVSMLVKRLGLEYTENAMVKEEDIVAGCVGNEKVFNTILMVVGHSLKGLGAAGISEVDELARVKSVMKVVKENNIPLVLVHIGGEERRGPTSQPFIDAVLDGTKYIVVFKEGNKDNFFTDYGEEHKIPVTEISKIVEIEPVLKEMFDV